MTEKNSNIEEGTLKLVTEVSYCADGLTSTQFTVVDLNDIFYKIQHPEEKELEAIVKIRKLKEELQNVIDEKHQSEIKAEINVRKKDLPYFNLGIFKENTRANKNFLSTQFLLFDYDHIANLEVKRIEIQKDEEVFACFISPSGTGLKVIYKLEERITDYQFYSAFYKHYIRIMKNRYEIAPDNTCDASRCCTLSYDPGLYLNLGSQPLKIGIELLAGKEELAREIKTSGRQEILHLLEGVREGNRNTALIKICGALINSGIDENFACSLLKAWNLLNEPPFDEEELEKTIHGLYDRYFEEASGFLSYSEKGKTYKFYPYDFQQFLEAKNYYNYWVGESNLIIQIEDNLIRPIPISRIKKYILNLVSNPKAKNFIIDNYKKIFDVGSFEFIKDFNEPLNIDTAEKCYIYFLNGFVEITKDVISPLQPYSNLKRPIWNSKMIARNLTFLPNKEDYLECEFNTFLHNVTNNREDWYNALTSAFGYLCHSYYNPALRRAVVLLDEELGTDDKEPNGRVGKSICGQAMEHFKPNTKYIDGANLKEVKQFTFQALNADTEFVRLEDLNADFEFKTMFSVITEGVTIEKKYQTPFVNKNIKFLLTSNFAMGGKGTSYDGRLSEHEFFRHYRTDFTPEDEFGHRLFDGWDETEWNKFDNLMLSFIQYHLKFGLLSYEKKNLAIKKFIKATCQDFYYFAEYFEVGVRYEIKELLLNYNVECASPYEDIKQNTLTKWLRAYAILKKWKLVEESANRRRSKYITFQEYSEEEKFQKAIITGHIRKLTLKKKV
ncbi:MAG: hypothetical protein CVV24_08130 [Ignavibacteriae bacterium HGW-Ignavibacteriae-3]|nr:MAG: hypothetical protein CVV24_08130 [Ignavibacteriae bacterium HGW-Ignavibacteriae-3]